MTAHCKSGPMQRGSHSTSHTASYMDPNWCWLLHHACKLQIHFRLFRHDKHLLLMVLTRLLTTLAHVYNLVGWLKMQNPLSISLSLSCANRNAVRVQQIDIPGLGLVALGLLPPRGSPTCEVLGLLCTTSSYIWRSIMPLRPCIHT